MNTQPQKRLKSRIAPITTATRTGLLQRKCSCGGTPGADGECPECRKKRLQRQSVTSLTPFTPGSSAHQGILQRCDEHGECAECRAKRLSMQRGTTAPAATSVPPIVHEVLSSPGHSLDAGTRSFMEPRFGHDFSHVRIHTDTKAAESARSVNALAYTVENDLVFGAGQYRPDTDGGKRLMAHELTHVVQQHGNALQRKLTIGEPGDAYEQEADRIANSVMNEGIARTRPGAITSPIAPSIQRTCGSALGSPTPDCKQATGDISGEVFYFFVNCDDLQPDEHAHLATFARGLAKGMVLNVHGYASIDGDASFNMSLSCHRANKIATMLRTARPDLTVTIPGYKHGATAGDAKSRRSVIVEAVKPTPDAPSSGGVTGVRDLSRIRIDAVPDFLASSLTAPQNVNVHVTDAAVTHITWELFDPNGRPKGSFSTLPGRADSLTIPFTLNPPDFQGASFIPGKYLLRCSGLNATNQPIIYADRDFYVLESDLTTGAALATTYGDLTFTAYNKTDASPPAIPNYHIDVALQFLPKSTVPCNDVTFIQSIQTLDKEGRSQQNTISADQDARKTPLAWSIDQLAGIPSPFYIVGRNPVTGAFTDDPAYGLKGHGGTPPGAATLIDRPEWNRENFAKFETCAMCRSGTNRGQVYGCATWGYTATTAGKVTLTPRSFRQMPSDQFEEATAAWNAWRITVPAATRPQFAPNLTSPR